MPQYQLHYHDAGSVPAKHPNGRGRFWEDDSSLATPTPVQQLSDVSDSNETLYSEMTQNVRRKIDFSRSSIPIRPFDSGVGRGRVFRVPYAI